MSTNRYIDKLKARLAKEADQRMQLQALLDDQVARNRALLAERDALKKDAERYRWLNNPANFHAAVSQQLWLLHGSQEFGERIDKAIGKGEQP